MERHGLVFDEGTNDIIVQLVMLEHGTYHRAFVGMFFEKAFGLLCSKYQQWCKKEPQRQQTPVEISAQKQLTELARSWDNYVHVPLEYRHLALGICFDLLKQHEHTHIEPLRKVA